MPDHRIVLQDTRPLSIPAVPIFLPCFMKEYNPAVALTITTEVENFPGYPDGVTGPVLMDDLKRQAERFGADIRNGIVTKADLSKAPYTFVVDDEKEITADTVIISTGATAKYLGLEDEKEICVWVSVPVLLATDSSIARKP